MLIETLANANPNQRKLLNEWLEKKDFDRKEKIKVVMDLYHELNIRVIAEKEMMKYFEEAMMNLDEINIPEMNKSALRQFALTLLVREH